MRLPTTLSLILFSLTLASRLAADPSTAIRNAIAPLIESEEIAGAVTLVARDGEIIDFQAHGLANRETGQAMQTDNLFWIASMTKPLAGVAIMMLQEEGKLSVHDPVSKHLPEFANPWLIAESGKDSRRLVKPEREVTLFDLLTHTAGVPSVNEPRSHSSLAELVALISQQPLGHQPGARWKYSSGGTNVLGRVVEVVSGTPIQEFIAKRITEPIGMKDTTFYPSKRQAKRIATSYLKNEDNPNLTPITPHWINGASTDQRRTPEMGGGLCSSAEDMRRFYQMMLDGGVWNGKRLLSEKSVQELTRTQTGDIVTGFTDGMSWGLSFQVVKEPQGVTAMLNPGTFGHGGAYGTQSWADPENRTIYVLMIQRRGFNNGDNSPVRHAFQIAAAAALD